MIRGVPAQNTAICHDDAAFDHILQLSDIAGPVMLLESRHHIIGNPVDDLALLAGELLNKVLCEK
jgi:hypothetical protein